MVVVAHAHTAEVAAMKARDRALARLAAVWHDIRALGVENPAELPEAAWRRFLRAQVASGAAMSTFFATSTRHSKWYRAYRRARRSTDAQTAVTS